MGGVEFKALKSNENDHFRTSFFQGLYYSVSCRLVSPEALGFLWAFSACILSVRLRLDPGESWLEALQRACAAPGTRPQIYLINLLA